MSTVHSPTHASLATRNNAHSFGLPPFAGTPRAVAAPTPSGCNGADSWGGFPGSCSFGASVSGDAVIPVHHTHLLPQSHSHFLNTAARPARSGPFLEGSPLTLQLGSPDLSRRSSLTSLTNTMPRNAISLVADDLYIGCHKAACDEELSLQEQIGAYLCVAAELSPALPPFVDPMGVERGEIGFLHLPLDDNATCRLASLLPVALEFIDAQTAMGRSVLVYCQAGKSRSASVAIAYLMRERSLSVIAALASLQACHPVADPNIYFLDQLSQWDSDRRRCTDEGP